MTAHQALQALLTHLEEGIALSTAARECLCDTCQDTPVMRKVHLDGVVSGLTLAVQQVQMLLRCLQPFPQSARQKRAHLN